MSLFDSVLPASPSVHAPVPLVRGRVRARLARALAGLLVAAAGLHTVPAQAQAEPFLGQLALVGFNFCPRGWLPAQGQLLPIAQNTALFALLGTQFGGNGQTTFGLPDLRGRVPIGQGQGPGLPDFTMGQRGGTENVSLTTSQMPLHTHGLTASTQAATHAAPANDRVLAVTQNAGNYVAATPNTALHASSVGFAGGSQPVPVRDPFMTLNWCIATEGIFPSRP